MATNRNNKPLEPAYKHHLATDDQNGVVVAEAVTGDSGYASAENDGLLERKSCVAVIAMPREQGARKLPKERFKVDRRQRAKCPAGRWMKGRQQAVRSQAALVAICINLGKLRRWRTEPWTSGAAATGTREPVVCPTMAPRWPQRRLMAAKPPMMAMRSANPFPQRRAA